MTLIINNEYSVKESFEDKYNLEINDCVVDIQLYCKNNNLPFINNFNYNHFMEIIKKNVNFSKIEVINIDDESSDEDVDSDDEYLRH